MKTLVLDELEAKKIYPTADPAFKKVLESTFGVAHFTEKITDKVKSFEDACKVLSLSPKHVIYEIDELDEDTQAYEKLKIIVRALNEGWAPDWKNAREYKYYPWFDLSGSDGFSFYDVGHWCASSCVGSRLCFKSDELARYAGKQFLSLYRELMVIE
jgi:hypothetical protein